MVNFVARKIGDLFIVWFFKGNQYFSLEEPAYFVFNNIINGVSVDKIIEECAIRYKNSEEECSRFVKEIILRIESINSFPAKSKSQKVTDQDIPESFKPYSVYYYQIGLKYLCFKYENSYYEQFIHPLLEHLVTNKTDINSIKFELFGEDDNIILRVNNQLKGSWNRSETHLIKGMSFLQILNVVYEKSDEDWMAVIHASAVSNDNKTILFAASPGSGKSTIAALLQKQGYKLVSDDFVAIEQLSKKAFPFPAAISVKEGAKELLSEFYPSLKEKELSQRSVSNKIVSYLPNEINLDSVPVQEIVFIKYDTKVDFNMDKLSSKEALTLLLEEAWTYPSMDNANQFLDWFDSLSFYNLSYSNTKKALDAINSLFEE